jgi:hypothetical protein
VRSTSAAAIEFVSRLIQMQRLKRLQGKSLNDAAIDLSQRISAEFPERGLTKEARELARDASSFVQEAQSLSRKGVTYYAIRLLVILGIGSWLGTMSLMLLRIWRLIEQKQESLDLFQSMQGIDSGIHIAVSAALAIIFVATLERRRKRGIAFNGLNSLLNFAHVIDSHQTDKDPTAFASGLPRIGVSSKVPLDPPQLLRYLDYCSEMLSLVRRFAALYGQESGDTVIAELVDGIADLTSSLSNKIWQKITILNNYMIHRKIGGYRQAEHSHRLLQPSD